MALGALAVLFTVGPRPAFAYQVWIGTHTAPASAGTPADVSEWALTAKTVTGVNGNQAAPKPTPDTPAAGETAPTQAQWITIFQQFTAATRGSVLQELPRSTVALEGGFSYLDRVVFPNAAALGITITELMIYDDAVGKDDDGGVGVYVDSGTHAGEYSYSWSSADVTALRSYLDANGHSSVKLMFDARSEAAIAMCRNPLINDIMLEASDADWATNLGGRVQLLKTLSTDPATSGKRLVFQIVTDHDPYDTPSAYQQARSLVVRIGQIMGPQFLQSPNVIFEPVTYNGVSSVPSGTNPLDAGLDETVAWLPETAPGNPCLYANSITGAALSLAEQRDSFEGEAGAPAMDFASSYVRTAGECAADAGAIDAGEPADGGSGIASDAALSDAAAGSNADSGATPPGASSGSCGCAEAGAPATAFAPVAWAGLVAAALRRRRKGATSRAARR